MRASAFAFYPDFDVDQRITHECSDRVFLPQAYFYENSMQENDVLMVTSPLDKSVFCTIHSIHNYEADMIYLPSWMIFELEILENLSISTAPKKYAKGLCLRPHSAAFAKRGDFVEKLNAGILNYKCLAKYSKIPLNIDGRIEFLTIDDITPPTLTTCFVYNCGKINIKITSAKELEKDSLTYLFHKPKENRFKFAFLGTGHLLGGTTDTSLPPIAAAANAARKRFELIAAGKRPY
jgi:hypothetical protein